MVKLIDPYHVAHINYKMVNLVWNPEVDWGTKKNKDAKKKLKEKFLDCNKGIIVQDLKNGVRYKTWEIC